MWPECDEGRGQTHKIKLWKQHSFRQLPSGHRDLSYLATAGIQVKADESLA